MTFIGRMDEGQLEFGWKWIIGPLVWLLVGFLAFELVPAWSAHLGHGRPGVWTVTEVRCSKRSCTPIGDFTSTDGGDVRHGVALRGTAGDEFVGTRYAAIDTGDPDNRVFPADGGNTWLAFTIATIVVSLPAGLWAWIYPITGIRRLLARRRGSRAPRA